MYYTIGEIARIMNVAPSTLRYYDKEGLLPFIERSSGGIRMFKKEDLSALEVIECLKQTGMPITEIRKFMDLCTKGDSTIEERLALINRQYEVMLEQQKQMMATIHMLQYKQWYYTIAREAGTCDVHKDMPLEMIPEEFHDIVQNEERDGDLSGQ